MRPPARAKPPRQNRRVQNRQTSAWEAGTRLEARRASFSGKVAGRERVLAWRDRELTTSGSRFDGAFPVIGLQLSCVRQLEEKGSAGSRPRQPPQARAPTTSGAGRGNLLRSRHDAEIFVRASPQRSPCSRPVGSQKQCSSSLRASSIWRIRALATSSAPPADLARATRDSGVSDGSQHRTARGPSTRGPLQSFDDSSSALELRALSLHLVVGEARSLRKLRSLAKQAGSSRTICVFHVRLSAFMGRLYRRPPTYRSREEPPRRSARRAGSW